MIETLREPSVINTAPSLAEPSAADTVDGKAQLHAYIVNLQRQIAALRARLAILQKRNPPIAMLLGGQIVVFRSSRDGDYMVMRPVAVFLRPEQALAFAAQLERETVAEMEGGGNG